MLAAIAVMLEFSAEDARAVMYDFLALVIERVIDAGATVGKPA